MGGDRQDILQPAAYRSAISSLYALMMSAKYSSKCRHPVNVNDHPRSEVVTSPLRTIVLVHRRIVGVRAMPQVKPLGRAHSDLQILVLLKKHASMRKEWKRQGARTSDRVSLFKSSNCEM